MVQESASSSPEQTSRDREHFAQRLHACGIQPTSQRLRIAALLLQRPQHMTAEQILAGLRESGMRVSKATVYNTVNLFAERGVIAQVFVDGTRAWFDSNTSPHHHFRCLETGEVLDVPAAAVEFKRLPPAPDGMEYAGFDLVIRLRRRR